jgi:5'-nucleotidase
VSVRQYDGRVVPTKDPFGRDLFWFTVKPLDQAEEGTDRWAIEQNWISMTPLRVDLTDEDQLTAVAERRPLDRARAAATSPATSSTDAVKAVVAEEAAAPIEL